MVQRLPRQKRRRVDFATPGQFRVETRLCAGFSDFNETCPAAVQPVPAEPSGRSPLLFHPE